MKLGSEEHLAKGGHGKFTGTVSDIGLPPSHTHTPCQKRPTQLRQPGWGLRGTHQSVHEDPAPPVPVSVFSSGDQTRPSYELLPRSDQALQMAPACPPPQESKSAR